VVLYKATTVANYPLDNMHHYKLYLFRIVILIYLVKALKLSVYI